MILHQTAIITTITYPYSNIPASVWQNWNDLYSNEKLTSYLHFHVLTNQKGIDLIMRLHEKTIDDSIYVRKTQRLE